MDLLGVILEKYGILGLILLKLGEVLWNIFKKKYKADEELAKAVHELTKAIKPLEDMPIHMRRAFTAIKIISKDKWPEIREEIMKKDPLDQ
jgi:hypothetical protein